MVDSGDEPARDRLAVVAEHEGGELVPADPSEQVFLPDDALHRPGGSLEQAIAGRVPQALIHRAEPVEVDHDQRARLIGARQPRKRVDVAAEGAPRQQAGERVVCRVVTGAPQQLRLLARDAPRRE